MYVLVSAVSEALISKSAVLWLGASAAPVAQLLLALMLKSYRPDPPGVRWPLWQR